MVVVYCCRFRPRLSFCIDSTAQPGKCSRHSSALATYRQKMMTFDGSSPSRISRTTRSLSGSCEYAICISVVMAKKMLLLRHSSISSLRYSSRMSSYSARFLALM